MEGWIKLHRNIMDHWLYNDNSPFSKREAWIDLLLITNHTGKEIPIGNQIFLCKRGQSMRSLDSYARRFKWSKSKVNRFLKLLEKQHMIETENLQKTTRITICNYDKYQGLRNIGETLGIIKGNADETLAKPNKNVKNKKEEKKEMTIDNSSSNLNNKKDPYYVEI